MPHLPDFQTFKNQTGQADLIPVYRRLIGDSLTPVSAFHKLDIGGPACLFESVVGGEKVGRYSFLASEPFLQIEASGRQVMVRDGDAEQSFESADPLAELRTRMKQLHTFHPPDLPPFIAGAVGYAGYDTVRYSERLPNAPEDDRGLPDLSFAFYDHMIVFDNVTKTVVVIAMARPGRFDDDARAAYDDACRRVDRIVNQLESPTESLRPADIQPEGDPRLEYTSNFTREGFESAVRRCVEYIRAGDIFQVVLSQRLALPLRCEPFEVYRTLRIVNPSPFMFYLRTPAATLVGSSPEIMARVVDGQLTVRPLAGTRRRGQTEEEDRLLAEQLLADPKERAEHVMLVDLGRNDVGRVARYGSVRLADVMTVERYSHVMHISSTVTGTLREEVDAIDALRACLPAGTLSGAPKVRAMEIIDELEPHRRGPYGGAVGYIDFSGNMDTCIALRTIVVQDRVAYVQAGAGIVADSQPDNEFEETINKARGLLKAIEITQRRTTESRG